MGLGEETPGGQRRSCPGGAVWGKVRVWKAAQRLERVRTERGLSSGSGGLIRAPYEGSCRSVAGWVGGESDFLTEAGPRGELKGAQALTHMGGTQMHRALRGAKGHPDTHFHGIPRCSPGIIRNTGFRPRSAPICTSPKFLPDINSLSLAPVVFSKLFPPQRSSRKVLLTLQIPLQISPPTPGSS